MELRKVLALALQKASESESEPAVESSSASEKESAAAGARAPAWSKVAASFAELGPLWAAGLALFAAMVSEEREPGSVSRVLTRVLATVQSWVEALLLA
jgi:hypothetical protein